MEAAMTNVSRLVPSRSSDILNECRDMALSHLPISLKATLDQIDDALFEIANKADNSARQNRFFDAMRELRMKRDDFEKDFVDTFGSEFKKSITPENINSPKTVDFANTMELSLVDTDEVEEDLAVTNFVESVNTRCREELFGLDKRMGMLLSDPTLEHDKNPLSPAIIGKSFKHACEMLDSDIEVKLTLYKLFDKYTCPNLHHMYGAVNQHLVKREVLPTIASGHARQAPTKGKTRVTIENDNEIVEAIGNDVFSTLQGLMQGNPNILHNSGIGGVGGGNAGYGNSFSAGVNTGGHAGGMMGGGSGIPNNGMNGGFSGTGGGGVATNGGAGGIGGVLNAQGGSLDGALGGGHGGGQESSNRLSSANGASNLQMLDTSSFVETLTLLQHGDVSGLEETVLSQMAPAELKSNLAAGNVNVLRSLSHAGAVGQLNQTDGMTLDIVSILFDYVFDDKAIPDLMKALIGKLQIPVLKVALLDKDLFSKKSHPARRLIDVLAKSSVGYTNTSTEEKYFQYVEKIIQYVTENFTDDVELFNSAVTKLEEFLEQETLKTEERAERAARSLSTKEQIVHAKLAVDDALSTRLEGIDVREFVRQFVLDYWRQLLIVTYIEDGADSEAWHQQLQTIDDLIWSLDDKSTPEDKKTLAEKLPAMLQQIRAGMKTLDMDRQICSKILSMLASVHVVSVKNSQETSLAEQRLNTRPIPDEPLTEGSDEQTKQAFIKKGLERIFETKDADESEIELDPSLFNDDVVVEQAEPEILPTIKNLNKYLAMITAMDLGDWVEFDNEDGTSMRARFTWISPATGRYLFTTRQGQKAMDTTLGKLAELFSKDTARHIESQPDPIFERALGDLMGRLESA